MIKKHFWLLLLILYSSTAQSQQFIQGGGHSHNDYYQSRPLFEALEHNMASIEADISYETKISWSATAKRN
ncbi:MAG: hypothetical protein HC830_14685 [Bacteroidetes bacterium]|nr:hypothetical protein [Bacteroidota bacterium]